VRSVGWIGGCSPRSAASRDHSGISPRPPRGRGGGGEGAPTQGRVAPNGDRHCELTGNNARVSPHPRPLSQKERGVQPDPHQSHPTSLLAQARVSRGALSALPKLLLPTNLARSRLGHAGVCVGKLGTKEVLPLKMA
jgi:hypothetical protein